MGSFDGKIWKIYLDEEARERRDQIKDHLEENYEGPSDFGKQALMDENVLTVEERLERLRKDKKELEQKEERLQQIIREREQQDKLRDKRELLKEKQKKLREVSDKDPLSRQEAEEKALQYVKEKNASTIEEQDLSDEEIKEFRGFKKKVEELTSDVDIDSLVEDVQRLQRQVRELNGGEEDYFMDLETVENSEVQKI